MSDRAIKIRRGKRTDFPALQGLLTPAQQAAVSKAQIRHWRRLAGDARHDFYVAEQEGAILGSVLVCYVRGLRHSGWQAILDIVLSPFGPGHIGQALLSFAKTRARKRGCRHLFICSLNERGHDECLPLIRAGFHRAGDVLFCELH